MRSSLVAGALMFACAAAVTACPTCGGQQSMDRVLLWLLAGLIAVPIVVGVATGGVVARALARAQLNGPADGTSGRTPPPAPHGAAPPGPG